jgi:hypothetical protein
MTSFNNDAQQEAKVFAAIQAKQLAEQKAFFKLQNKR